MSNTYVDVSSYFAVDAKHIDTIKELLKERWADDDEDEFYKWADAEGLNIEVHWPGFSINYPNFSDGFIQMYSDDGEANTENAIEFGMWLVRNNMVDRFELRWAMYGGDVGGGAAVIDKTGRRWVDSEQWLINDSYKSKED